MRAKPAKVTAAPKAAVKQDRSERAEKTPPEKLKKAKIIARLKKLHPMG